MRGKTPNSTKPAEMRRSRDHDGRETLVVATDASDPIRLARLLSTAPAAVTPRMEATDPQVAQGVVEAGRAAVAALAAWRRDTDPDDILAVGFDAWAARVLPHLKEVLEPAAVLMEETRRLARTRGVADVFHAVLVDPSDDVLLASVDGRPTGFMSCDAQGPKLVDADRAARALLEAAASDLDAARRSPGVPNPPDFIEFRFASDEDFQEGERLLPHHAYGFDERTLALRAGEVRARGAEIRAALGARGLAWEERPSLFSRAQVEPGDNPELGLPSP